MKHKQTGNNTKRRETNDNQQRKRQQHTHMDLIHQNLG